MPVFLAQPEIIDLTVGLCIFSTSLLSGAFLLSRSQDEDDKKDMSKVKVLPVRLSKSLPRAESLSEEDESSASY